MHLKHLFFIVLSLFANIYCNKINPVLYFSLKSINEPESLYIKSEEAIDVFKWWKASYEFGVQKMEKYGEENKQTAKRINELQGILRFNSGFSKKIECDELQVLRNRASQLKLILNTFCNDFKELENQFKKLKYNIENKATFIAENIAKKQNASLIKNCTILIDPRFDITDRCIEQLNREYRAIK